MSTLKQIRIKKARKDHNCNSCEWLTSYSSKSEYLFKEFNFTEEEKETIFKAENNRWKVKKGDSCDYIVGVYDGDFCAFYQIPEIHDICVKYDLYDY